MKKSILAISALAAMLFAGCTSSDELTTLESIKNEKSAPEPIQFGTYMGKVGTRAGTEGTITSAQLLANKGGFGVFGYYTGASTYNDVQYNSGYQDLAANFMFNQQISGTDVASPVWSYSPIKYWPNEIQNGDVDDDKATSTNSKGGKISFFAYAPYVAFPITPTTDGIVAINENTALASANAVTGDPTLTYTIPADLNADATGAAFVDLMWGTLDGTTQNAVTVSTNTGVTGTNASLSANPIRPTSGTYAANILNGYTTNADLAKQKTEGVVGFNFKHALSKIGGYGNGTTTGILVKLDLDNNGAETGGVREKYDANSDADYTDDDDMWRTIVTIKEITITNDIDGSSDINGSEVGLGGTRTLNLATGCWSTDAVNNIYTQTIGTATTSPSYTPNAVLNTKLAEIYDDNTTTWLSHLTAPNYFKNSNALDATKAHPGVTETAQPVYNSTTQSPIVLFPGTTPQFKITVDYIVRTYDANLSAGYSEVEQVITKTITFSSAVGMNKHYTILMHLGLTGIKFTASVTDWVTDFNGDSDVTDDYEEINLPINVQ